jgi:hypothetical protein
VQDAELLINEAGGTYNYHWLLRVNTEIFSVMHLRKIKCEFLFRTKFF